MKIPMHLTIDENVLKALKIRRINISKHVEGLVLRDMALKDLKRSVSDGSSNLPGAILIRFIKCC